MKALKVLVVSILVLFGVFAFSGVANAQTLWKWKDSIRPISSEDAAVVIPIECVPAEPNCASWHTYRDGVNRPIWMEVTCHLDGVTIGSDGKEVYEVPEGQQLVVAFTARPCTDQGTPTPPVPTATPMPTATPTITATATATVTATPQPWATEGWGKYIRTKDGNVHLNVQPCSGEAKCWTWSSWDGQISTPVDMELRLCNQEGTRWEQGHPVQGLIVGVTNVVLGFTVRQCPDEVTVPTDTPSPTATPIPTGTPVPTETPLPTATPRPFGDTGWKKYIRTTNGAVELHVTDCENEPDCWSYSASEPIEMEFVCRQDGAYIDDQKVVHEDGVPLGIHKVRGFTARICQLNMFMPSIRR